MSVDLRYYTDALNTALTEAGITNEIAWPNKIYTPKKGIPYLGVENAGRNKTPLGIGADGIIQWVGIYQVGVTVPRDAGTRSQEIWAQRVMNTFARGANLPTFGGNVLTIEYSTAPMPTAFGDWSILPVQIHWFATEAP